MSGKAIMWLERVVLRGIEGIIGDRYLAAVLEGPVIGEGLSDYFESKYMAEQIFCDLRGWGLQAKRLGARRRASRGKLVSGRG